MQAPREEQWQEPDHLPGRARKACEVSGTQDYGTGDASRTYGFGGAMDGVGLADADVTCGASGLVTAIVGLPGVLGGADGTLASEARVAAVALASMRAEG